MNTTFSSQMLTFFKQLKEPKLPEQIEPLLPFRDPEVLNIMEQFYGRFFSDTKPRILLFGINPGRLGAGKTGIGFTDPIRLKEQCGIDHNIDMKPEPSSVFMYDMIDAFGGPEQFYAHFHFTSVSPVGYIKDGLNFNYYDTPALRKATADFVIKTIREQADMNVTNEVAFSIGKGTNFKILKKLNDTHGFFDRIEVLPHPRWVMQYKYKTKSIYLDEYIQKLAAAAQLL